MAFCYLVWPLHETMRRWSDFAFIYTAGKSWLHGLSPYDIPSWREEWLAVRPVFWEHADGIAPTQPFLYPPHWIGLASALALLPWPAANRLWDAVNLLSFVGLCAFSVALAPRNRSAAARIALYGGLALACLNGAVRYSFFNSQMSLLPTCAVVAAFWAARERRRAWLIAFVFVATLKPQIALLPLIYLLLNGSVIEVLLGSLAAALVSSITVLRVGPSLLLQQLSQCYAGHMQLAFNDLGHFTSVSSLFAGTRHAALAKSLSPLFGVGAVVLFSLWRRRSPRLAQRGPLWAIALCLAFSATFVPLHEYDLGLYTSLFVLLGEVRERSLAAALGGLAFLAGRVPVLEGITHLHPLAPCFALAISILLVVAAGRLFRIPTRTDSVSDSAPAGAP